MQLHPNCVLECRKGVVSWRRDGSLVCVLGGREGDEEGEVKLGRGYEG